MIKFSYLFVLCVSLWAGETTVVLKNGHKYLVRTLFGKPKHQSNEYFSISSIKPSFDKFEGWRNIHYFWAITIGMNKEFNGSIVIDSPLLPNKSWSFLLNSGPDFRYILVHRFQVMESDSTPEMWQWIKEPGESWIPFHIVATTKNQGRQIDFIEWVKITEDDKIHTRSDFIKIENFFNNYNTVEIQSITGEIHKIKMTETGPLRFENHFLQIDSLLPGIINNKTTDGIHPLALSISGKYRGEIESIIKITAPWANSNFSYQVKIHNSGNFQIPFAFSHLNPELWKWLNSTGDVWIPFQIHIDQKDSDKSFYFTEWFHVTDKIRNELQKMQALSTSS